MLQIISIIISIKFVIKSSIHSVDIHGCSSTYYIVGRSSGFLLRTFVTKSFKSSDQLSGSLSSVYSRELIYISSSLYP